MFFQFIEYNGFLPESSKPEAPKRFHPSPKIQTIRKLLRSGSYYTGDGILDRSVTFLFARKFDFSEQKEEGAEGKEGEDDDHAKEARRNGDKFSRSVKRRASRRF